MRRLMQKDLKKHIEKIVKGMNCPKDFICYKSNFKHICKVNIFGFEGVLECGEKEPSACSFSRKYLEKYQCTCTIRAYIFRKLEK